MPKVLITPEALIDADGPHIDLLKEAGFDIAFPNNPQFTRGLGDEEEGVDELSGADAVIAGSEHITAWMLDRLPQLRVIARNGVGFDRVDVPAATERNIVVTITPKSVHEAAAEHALALLLAVSKQIVAGDRAVRAGEWPRDLIEPVRRKTIGILGLGRIGRSMAIRAAAMGMTVIAHDAFPDETFAREHNIELVDFDTLIERCDVLSIHCPNTVETRGVINRDVFRRMKANAILINTARGPIVNEADLIAALQDGSIKAAGLDVFEQEPPAKDNPLFKLHNVVLTPHAAGADALAMRDMAIESASNVIALHQGQWPAGAVINTQLQGKWSW
ncbi:MAG: phosphoglycerate dehydrogenase [Fuerstiella sp.]